MPVRRLYRDPMIGWLESYQLAHPDVPFCPFVIGAYKRLNPYYTKLLSKNFSQLEAIAGYTGRFLLIDNARGTQQVPDRNITYYYQAIRKDWNDRGANILSQLRTNPYDFPVVKRPTRMNPDGSVYTVTYRFLEPAHGDDSVNLSQTDLDNSTAGMQRTRQRLDQCRDEQAVEIRIEELMRQWGL